MASEKNITEKIDQIFTNFLYHQYDSQKRLQLKIKLEAFFESLIWSNEIVDYRIIVEESKIEIQYIEYINGPIITYTPTPLKEIRKRKIESILK